MTQVQNAQTSILPFTEEDYLAPTGERIVADRYLLKDTKKETLTEGSLVVAVIDKKRAYHELAKVVEVDRKKEEVVVELRDGFQLTLPFNLIDVLKETSPAQMWERIAKAASVVTNDPGFWEKKFYELQSQWRYVPGGRINASLGTGVQTTSYNCFVIPNVGPTTYEIKETLKRAGEIQARSGGVGTNLSGVLPQGSICEISEKNRKAELNIVEDVWHPDLLDFLANDYKNATKVVRLSQKFRNAVENDEEWTFIFPDTTVESYDSIWNGDIEQWLEQGYPVVKGETHKAVDVYDKIVESGAMMVQDLIGKTLVPGDNRGGIYDTLGDMWDAMLIEKKKVNVVISSLRPRYSYVRGVNGRSSGAYTWAQLYDKGNWAVQVGFGPVAVGEMMSIGCQLTIQGGSRRGALMLILNDNHADIKNFITCKQVDGVITGANLSVGVSEEFMAARFAGESWNIGYINPERFEKYQNKYQVEKEDFIVTDSVNAEELWDMMMESAWKSAEPGVVFLGRYNAMSNSQYFNPIIATNPCGEQGLPAYGICNLGAIVLSKFVAGFEDCGIKIAFKDKEKEAYIRTQLERHFDKERAEFFLHHIAWEALEEITRTGLRFQDAIIDATYYPFEENERNQKGERRVGLGIMALHDLLIQSGVQYGSEESLGLVDVVMGMITEWTYLESVELSKENGPFPMFKADEYLQSGFMQLMAKEKPHVVEAIRTYGIRNVTGNTIAPTGTTGTQIGVATGCEPYYAWSYYRNSRLGLFEENAQIVQDYLDTHEGEELPSYFITAMELSPEGHVYMQAALQKWIDSSISKTCNAPNSYTVQDTKKLYELAYQLGCKGVTIYRDGSRSEQVLETKKEEKKEEVVAQVSVQTQTAATTSMEWKKKQRPDVLYGATYKKETPLGTAYITINDDPNTNLAREVFVNIGQAGTDVYASNTALGIALSMYLAETPNPDKEGVIVKKMSGIGGSGSVGFGPNRITSVPDAIAKSLIQHSETFPLRNLEALAEVAAEVEVKEETVAQIAPEQKPQAKRKVSLRDYNTGKDFCPQCHQHSLVRHGGCNECEACGFSKC